MNANSPQKTPVINEWLKEATLQLAGIGIASAKLDSELILAHTLRKPRTFLYAHADDYLDTRYQEIANARLQLRLDRVPLAYIIGHKEFYGRPFKVTNATLIPRPETETLISLLGKLLPKNLSLLDEAPRRLVDVGTGSGCLGITAKLEFPELDVSLLDISRHALKVATSNARSLNANVHLQISNLLADFPFPINYILANLPYVDPTWELSPELKHEPAEALFATDSGLHLIKKLIIGARTSVVTGGLLLLEADIRQLDDIRRFGADHGFKEVRREQLCIVLQRL